MQTLHLRRAPRRVQDRGFNCILVTYGFAKLFVLPPLSISLSFYLSFSIFSGFVCCFINFPSGFLIRLYVRVSLSFFLISIYLYLSLTLHISVYISVFISFYLTHTHPSSIPSLLSSFLRPFLFPFLPLLPIVLIFPSTPLPLSSLFLLSFLPSLLFSPLLP